MNQHNLILAIETSSRIGSVALGTENKLLAEKIFSAPIKHSAELFPAIDTLLSQTNTKRQHISQVYISIGPGSFTGLRIAVCAAKAMHLANKIKIITVDTLDIIAQNLHQCTQVDQPGVLAVIIDAKRGEFFVSAYEFEYIQGQYKNMHKILNNCIIRPEDLLKKFSNYDKPVYLIGDGLLYYSQKFSSEHTICLDQDYWSPKAAHVYELGLKKAKQDLFANPINLIPYYLREPQVTIKARP